MKIVNRILVALAVLVGVLILAVYCVWGNEISSLLSFRHVRARNDAHLDGSVYAIDIKGDFYLDDFSSRAA